jgi:hypothetical protein
MKKKLKKIRIVAVSVITIILFVILWLRIQENNNYYKRGAVLIEKVEAFRQTENRLPDNVNELGLKEPMNDGPYYEKKDSMNYIVFFCIGFDNAKIYYSDKKEWIDE